MPVRRTVSNSVVAPQPSEDTSVEAMATAAAKKARTEVVSYADMALEKLQIKEIGKSRNGSPTMVVLHDGYGFTFNLTPAGWLNSKYGFDVHCKYGRPSFLVNAPLPDIAASESLAIRLSIDRDQAISSRPSTRRRRRST